MKRLVLAWQRLCKAARDTQQGLVQSLAAVQKHLDEKAAQVRQRAAQQMALERLRVRYWLAYLDKPLVWRLSILLLAYGVMGLACFVVLWAYVPNLDYTNAAVMSIALLTGSDPYGFKDILESYDDIRTTAWGTAWVVHTVSWLIIPVVFSLVYGDLVGRFRKLQQREDAVRSLAKQCGIEPEFIPFAVQEIMAEIEMNLSRAAEAERERLRSQGGG